MNNEVHVHCHCCCQDKLVEAVESLNAIVAELEAKVDDQAATLAAIKTYIERPVGIVVKPDEPTTH